MKLFDIQTIVDAQHRIAGFKRFGDPNCPHDRIYANYTEGWYQCMDCGISGFIEENNEDKTANS